MKYHYYSLVTIATVSFFISTAISVPCNSSETDDKILQNSANTRFSVPRGTLMRKVILDSLRQEIKHLYGLKVLFVVKHLKVKDGWAWVHTLPQSPNGKNHYEDVSALLHLKGHRWEIVELACTEEDNTQCLSNPAFFLELRKRFPKVSKEILPEE